MSAFMNIVKYFLFIVFLSISHDVESDHIDSLVLKGEALIEVTIFKIDVYQASYYESPSGKVQLINLKYLRDVSKKHYQKGNPNRSVAFVAHDYQQ